MVTIKITREVRFLLEEYKADGESMNVTVNRLLDEVEDSMGSDMVLGDGSTNINVDRDTMSRIKSFRVRDNESYGRILHRALLLSDKFK